MTPNDQSVNDQTLQINDEAINKAEAIDLTSLDADPDDRLTTALENFRKNGKTELTMFQMFLQTALSEITEYNALIKDAKTQAKRDFYKKKIKKVTKRLQRLLPA